MITQLKAGLQATATREQKQIEALSAGLQKMSAQIESTKTAQQTVPQPTSWRLSSRHE
jgi:hypothetical protein